MVSGRPTSVEDWLAYIVERRNGLSINAAAKKTGLSYHACRDAELPSKKTPANYGAAMDMIQAVPSTNIPRYDELPPEAQKAWDNIDYFSERYFGVLLMPWQIEAAHKIVELLGTPEEEYAVINCPPGVGKSTFFTKILPAWLTVRNRQIRGLIGSNTQNLAEKYARALRQEFVRTVPLKADLNDLRLGLAKDAESCLPLDFGMFKPDESTVWRSDQFTVLQPDDVPISQKESTWQAYGRDSGFLGDRVDFIIWDDLYDPTRLRTADAREQLFSWWDGTAETRLEPGGLLLLQGQRMDPDDSYRYALDKIAPPAETELDDDEWERQMAEAANMEPGDIPQDWRKYHHIVYQAHYDDKCEGDHSRHAKPWPEGCLLFPRRLTWRRLRFAKANTPERYQITYQQKDMDVEASLINPLWISGGTGRDGVDYPGCWDKDRGLWEIPRGVSVDLVIASADPSPSKFWALQAWAINFDTEYRYLLECYRRKMDAPDFLDWNHSEGVFTGIAETWWQISKDIGHPITHWVVEANAAQKFILQYDHFRRWAAQRGVNLVAHYTHSRNKADPDYGVQMLAPHYKFGRVRLPGKQRTDARPHSLLLVNEATHWRADGSGSRTDDCVMAQWFVEHNLEKIGRPTASAAVQWRPSWVRDLG